MRTLRLHHAAALAAAFLVVTPSSLSRAQDVNPPARDPPPAEAAVRGDGSGDHSGEVVLTLGRVVGNEVNVRSGPSVDFKAVGRVHRDDVVLIEGVEGVNGEWCRVRLPGGPVAHVFAPLVTWEPGALRAKVTARDVLLRATPDKAFFAFKDQTLGPGDEVIVLEKVAGEGGDWLRCVVPETVHVWVFAKYVQALAPGDSAGVDLAAARNVRQDELTDGRTRTERAAILRIASAERAFAARLDIAMRRLDAGLAEEADAEALRSAATDAPTAALARRALDLALRVDNAVAERRIADAARSASESAAKDQQAAEEAARRAREETARLEELQRQLRDAEARRRQEAARADDEKKNQLREVVFEGTLTISADGSLVVVGPGGAAYAVASTRYRLPDYAGQRVFVEGRQPATGGRIDVTGLRVLPSAK